MIIINEDVYKIITEYSKYLINEGLTTEERAFQKIDRILQAINSNLGGILKHRLSPYKDLGKEEGYLLYVYKDPKTKTQWGFSYKDFGKSNIIVYYMKNLKLIKEEHN